MKKVILYSVLMALVFVFSCTDVVGPIEELETSVIEEDELELRGSQGYPWQDHASPFDFLFGNHIDNHQQTKELGNGNLNGFFYITFSGKFTPEGIPIATHGNCSMHPGECTVGWHLHGIPVQATLVAHGHGQHPTWCVDPDDMPNQPGYTHFHWLGQPEHAGGINIGETRDGYLLKLTANKTFHFKHHGGFDVTPGIDYETHANIVTDCD